MRRQTIVLMVAALIVVSSGLIGAALVSHALTAACDTGSTLLTKLCSGQP